MKKTIFALLLSLLPLFTCCSLDNQFLKEIISPYSTVNWSTFGQYKTALHVHTTNSDGENSPNEMIEDHYIKGYDIIAITDHNYLTKSLTFDKGMLQIPNTIEQSYSEHLNSFFVDFINKNNSSLEGNIAQVQALGGISHINHPGRYTGGMLGGEDGSNASNNKMNIDKYVNLFMKYSSCVGMEIINKKDNESASDRILWDNILQKTISRNRFVWGFSNDDTHRVGDTGYSYNVFIMSSNTTDNFKKAMIAGNFYAVAKVSKRELGDINTDGISPPVIKEITVNNSDFSITITADNYSRIDWISNGKFVIAGETIKIKEHENIGSYVRANIIGSGGIAFTQPFGLTLF